MIRLLEADRRRAQALKVELRKIERPAKEAARKERAAVRKSRAKASAGDDGSGYMAWLHDGIPCIACLVLGRHARLDSANPIEAAHQKLQLADRGFNRAAGRRGSHWTCVPLCAGHHRIGPLCCDPAQAKFWSIIGLTPDQLADYIGALNAAYREGRAGVTEARRFGDIAARGRRAA